MGALITVETRKIKDKRFVMPFGKHIFRSIKWILKHDPQYIRWLHENDIIKFTKKILKRIPEIYYHELDFEDDWYGF